MAINGYRFTSSSELRSKQDEINFYINQGREYRDSSPVNFEEVEAVFNISSGTTVQKNAISYGFAGDPDANKKNTLNPADESEINRRRLLKSEGLKDLNTLTSRILDEIKLRYRAVGEDAKAGDLFSQLKKEVDKRDNSETKNRDLILHALRDNCAMKVTMYSGIEKGTKDRFYRKTKIIRGKDILIDPFVDPKNIQDAKFIGWDNVVLPGREIRRVAERATDPYIKEAINNYVGNLIKEKTEEDNDYEFDNQSFDTCKIFIYDEKKGQTYCYLVLSEGGLILSVEPLDKFGVDGREIKYNVMFAVMNTIDGVFSESPAQEFLPLWEMKTQIDTDLVHMLSESRRNPHIVDVKMINQVKSAYNNGDKYIPAKINDLDNPNNYVIPLERPQIGEAQVVVQHLRPRLEQLSLLNSEAVGSSKARLEDTFQSNKYISDLVIRNLLAGYKHASEDDMRVFIKLVRLYGTDELQVRSLGIDGLYTTRVLDSKMLGDKGLHSISVDIIEEKQEVKFNDLKKKEFIAQLRSDPTVNQEAVLDFVLDCYDQTKSDKLKYKLPYNINIINAAYNDVNNVLLGSKILPSRMVSTGYVKTVDLLVNTYMEILTKPDGKPTQQGKDLISFLKIINSLYLKNAGSGSVAFENQESEDLAREEEQAQRIQSAREQGIEDPSKLAFTDQRQLDKEASLSSGGVLS